MHTKVAVVQFTGVGGGGGGQASDTSYVAYFDILLVHNECGWRVEWVWRVGWVRSKLLH